MIQDFAKPVVTVIGSVVALAGAAAMLGHITGVPPLYSQPGGTGMAFNTSVCLLLIGLAFVLIGRGGIRNHKGT